MAVRRAVIADSERVRDLRLRSLVDAPDAFGMTYEGEVRTPSDAWASLVGGTGWGGRSVVFLAEDDGRAVGLAFGVRHDEEPAEFAHLYAMWVDPEFRRRGHAAGLVGAVIGWAKDAGASRLRLGATETNPAAMELYKSLGFAPTGEADPLRPGSSLTCVVMERSL